MKRLLAKSILLAGGMSVSSQLYALGLGEMELSSALNQPLRGEIRLIDTDGLSALEIKPALASARDFEQAGVERYQFLTQMKFSVNGDRIVVTTRDPVNEPFLNFLVELNWPSGRVLREYTLLLDPPVFEEGRVQPLVAVPAGSIQNNTVATTQPAPAPAVQQTRTNSWNQPAAPGTYKVQPNDTLWQIALETRPNSSISPQQMMIALQDVNPDAFINGNINRLKTHTVLDIPDESIIQTITGREAVAEVNRQNRELNAGVAQIDATGRGSDTSGPRKTAGGGEVRLVSSQANGETSQAGGNVAGATGKAAALETDLAIALENLDKSQRENQELASRLEALEAQLAKMERLINLQNDQLAGMQAGAATQADSAKTSTVQPDSAQTAAEVVKTPEVAVAETATPAAEQPKAPEVQTAVTDGTAETAVATPDAENAEQGATDYNYADNSTAADAASAETASSEVTTSENSGEVVAEEVPAPSAEQLAMEARAAEEARKAATAAQKSPLDKIMALPMNMLAGIAGVVLLLIFLLLRLRSRKKEDEAVAAAEADLASMDSSVAAAEGLDDSLDNLDIPDGGLPDFGADDSKSADDLNDFNFDQNDDLNSGFGGDLGGDLGGDFDDNLDGDLSSLPDSADLDDLDGYQDADGDYETVGQTEDAISESDIYIAYGKFDQAVDLLNKAIAAEPERVDLRIKLLEVHSSLDDAVAFADAEASLLSLGDADANAQAAELRSQLSNPIEPELGDDAPLSLDGDLPSLDDSAESEFDNGMDFGEALDFGDDNTPDDDGIGASLEEVPELELGESSDFDAEKEGVDMSLEDDAVELDDELLNFDMDDDDNLDAKLVSEEESADEDVLPSLELDAEVDFELDEKAAEESDELGSLDFAAVESDFSADELSSEEVGSAESDAEPSASDPLELDVPDLELSEESDDLTLDFESPAVSSDNDALNDLVDDEEGLSALDLEGFDAEDAADDDTLPALDIDLSDDEAALDSGLDLEVDAGEAVETDLSSAFDLEEADFDALEVEGEPEVEAAVEGETSEPEAAEETNYAGLEDLMSADAGELADNSDLIGGIDLDELAAADDEFDFLAGTDECATKLDLARAYVDMEDIDGARELLQEVVQEGSDAQKQEAKDLMDTLS